MSIEILSWLYDGRRCGLLIGISLTRGFLGLLSIWSFYYCCPWARGFKLDGQSADVGTNINLTSGSSISSEAVDGGELGFSPLVRSATRLLRHNYVEELEATIPSPFIDPHQVKILSRCRDKGFRRIPSNPLFPLITTSAVFNFCP